MSLNSVATFLQRLRSDRCVTFVRGLPWNHRVWNKFVSGWCGVHYVHHINPSRAELQEFNTKTRLPILSVICWTRGLKKASGAIKLQFLYNNYLFLQSVTIPFCSPQNLSATSLASAASTAKVSQRILYKNVSILKRKLSPGDLPCWGIFTCSTRSAVASMHFGTN